MRAVNLLPSEQRGSRNASGLGSLLRRPLLLLASAVLIAVVAGLALEVRSASSTVATRQLTLRQLEAQVAELPKPAQNPGTAGTSAQRLDVLTAVAQARTNWDGFLSALSRVIPEDVWLLDLSASAASSSASSSSPSAFTVTGYTYSQPSVARLMRRLRMVPWLGDVSLTTSSKTSLNDHLVYQFTLGANVNSLPEVKQ